MKNKFLLIAALATICSAATAQESKPQKVRTAESKPVQENRNTETKKGKGQRPESPGVQENNRSANPNSNSNNNKVNTNNNKGGNSAAARSENASPADFDKFNKPLISNKNNGLVDWSNQYIEAKGEALIDTERFKNRGQAVAMATRGATVVAQRNLLEIINGVYVVGETTVENLATTNDVIRTRVEGVLRGAQPVGDPVEKNGMIEIKVRVPLYAANGIAPVVHDYIPNTKIRSEMNTAAEVSASDNKSLSGTEDIQNIIFNMAGKKFDPAMFPIVTDENNNVLLDYSKFYDPKKGVFPKIMQTSKEALEMAKNKKGVEIIDVIEAQAGKLVVPEKVAQKINWKKIGGTAAKIGSFLMMLL
jgi:hypothetical protein